MHDIYAIFQDVTARVPGPWNNKSQEQCNLFPQLVDFTPINERRVGNLSRTWFNSRTLSVNMMSM
jgi:hypothetical protein